MIIVTSGAVGVGRQRLRKQAALRRSMLDVLTSEQEYTLHIHVSYVVTTNMGTELQQDIQWC